MEHGPDRPAWWVLHLRKAKGEHLSEAEQQLYDVEMAHQDQAAALQPLAALRELRASINALAQQNADVRTRLAQLEQEIHSVEQTLSRQTRELLGVQE